MILYNQKIIAQSIKSSRGFEKYLRGFEKSQRGERFKWF
jgi:hypothetical protein